MGTLWPARPIWLRSSRREIAGNRLPNSRVVDRRADVWAFGCVLFELLAGRRAFAGETISEVLAKVLERDPDWSALPVERIRLDAHLSLHVAESHAVAGDNTRALVLLRQAVEQGFHPYAFIARHSPFFEALRRDVTFEQIVAEAHIRCEGFRV